MWKVYFEHVLVFTSKTDVEAVQFALSLHQASNVAHRVDVVKLDSDSHEIVEDGVVCTLIRE